MILMTWQNENLCTFLVTMEISLAVLKKLNIELPLDPVILILGIHPRELKTYSQKNLHTAFSHDSQKNGNNSNVHQLMDKNML